jgi:histidinol-phosphate aminotransferase
VPDEADLVVVGNPTNPTSVLHPKDQILALRRPGRVVVVDEAFADAIPGEPESVAGLSLPDVLVLRSLTKTWSLAGLRVGYALGEPRVLERMIASRPHWPLGTLQLEAIAACSSPEAVAEGEAGARRLAALRLDMVAGFTAAGLDVVDVRPVLIQRLQQAVPGQLGKLARRMADAGVNIDVQYSDHDHQLILVVDDVARGRAVSDAWRAEHAQR